MPEQAWSAERPNEERSDEWLDRLVRRLLVRLISNSRYARLPIRERRDIDRTECYSSEHASHRRKDGAHLPQ